MYIKCIVGRFSKISVSSYEHCKQKAHTTHALLFGETKYSFVSASDLYGSNLTFTFDGFSNKQHKDKDDNDYTFGMWFPVHSQGSNTSFTSSFSMICFRI